MIASAHLANHRTKDTVADPLLLLVDQHRGLGIEPDHRPIGTADILGGPNDDGAMHVPLLHAAAWSGVLHRHHDDVAYTGRSAFRAAQHLDALHRSEERRVGEECVSTCRSWWSLYH